MVSQQLTLFETDTHNIQSDNKKRKLSFLEKVERNREIKCQKLITYTFQKSSLYKTLPEAYENLQLSESRRRTLLNAEHRKVKSLMDYLGAAKDVFCVSTYNLYMNRSNIHENAAYQEYVNHMWNAHGIEVSHEFTEIRMDRFGQDALMHLNHTKVQNTLKL